MLKLAATKREKFGKQLKSARAAGELPVVMYGRKLKPAPLFVKMLEFKKIFEQAGESSVITVTGAAGDENVIIHEVAFNPVTSEPIHADFFVVEKDVALEVAVPIEFTGVSPAVKELGGLLIKVLHELKIEALPQDLPPKIIVDLALLAVLESQILVRDLVLPKAVKVLNDLEEVIASIAAAAEETVEETEPADLSAIEVEKRGKEEKVEGEEAGTGEAKISTKKKAEKR